MIPNVAHNLWIKRLLDHLAVVRQIIGVLHDVHAEHTKPQPDEASNGEALTDAWVYVQKLSGSDDYIRMLTKPTPWLICFDVVDRPRLDQSSIWTVSAVKGLVEDMQKYLTCQHSEMAHYTERISQQINALAGGRQSFTIHMTAGDSAWALRMRARLEGVHAKQ